MKQHSKVYCIDDMEPAYSKLANIDPTNHMVKDYLTILMKESKLPNGKDLPREDVFADLAVFRQNPLN